MLYYFFLMYVYFYGDKKNVDMMDNIKKLFKLEIIIKFLCFYKNNFILKWSVLNLNNYKYRTINIVIYKLC